MAKWMLRRTTADILNLSRQAGIPPVLAHILAVRGYKTPEAINEFINDNKPLSDPLLFADMAKAVQLTAAAINAKQKIAIFGDYDADGIMSTVILYRTLVSLGADVSYYIPKREGEGYGLNTGAINTLKEQGIELIIACDNGISAFDEIEHAASLGLTTVILDHHAVFIDEQEGGAQHLPLATAVVDAKRVDCQYPFKHYCAAGLCYRFSEALYAYYQKDWQALGEYLLPFAAIATVCDLVELLADNRYLVKKGLLLITKSANLGLKALLAATNLKDKAIDTYHVGFILGPCINASGRLGIADIAVELFLTEDPALAQKIAQDLVELNTKRKTLTEDGTKLALAAITEQNLAANKIIVLYCPQILESVAGIIAGKIKEKYYKPVIIIAGDNDILHGSCRSIEAYNIFDGLKSCQEYLLAFGGHPMAAGLSIERNQIANFADAINSLCKLTDEDMEAIYRIDCQLPPTEANLMLAKQLNLLAPYGKGNAKPLFAYKNLSLERITLVGREEKVMRLLLKDSQGWLIELIDFAGKERMQAFITSLGEEYWPALLAGKSKKLIKLDIIYSVSVNAFNGKESAQLQIVDFRPSLG